MLGLLMMAPDLAELVVDGLAHRIARTVVQEVAGAAPAVASGLLGGLGESLGLSAAAAAGGLVDDLQDRVRTGLEETLTSAGAVLASGDEVALLLKIAVAAEGRGDVATALASWNAWRAAHPRSSLSKP